MKKFLFLLFLLPLLVSAQVESYGLPLDSATGLITFTGVVKVSPAGPQELFIRALQFVSQTFQNPDSVIRYKDKDLGKIIFKARTTATADFKKDMPGVINFEMTIEVKDSRYKYSVSHIDYFETAYPMTAEKIIRNITDPEKLKSARQWCRLYVDGINKAIPAFIASLNIAMEPTNTPGTNW
jgi:hypothetical protein